MTLDSLIGTALFILQCLALCWAVMIACRAVFGIGFDSAGQVAGVKPMGKFIIRVVNKTTRVAEETVRGAVKAVKDLTGSNQASGDPEILDASRVDQEVDVKPAMRHHEKTHS